MSIEVKEKKITPCNECVLYESCKNNTGKKSEDICLWSTIHFIVKDYKNMFNKYMNLEPLMKQKRETVQRLRDQNLALRHELFNKRLETLSDEELKYTTKKLIDSVERSKEEREALNAQIKLLYEQIEETKNSRNAVVEAVTADLEEELEEANRKIKLLAEAAVEPGKADSVFLQSCKVHTIETDDDKKWMDKAMKQLEKASQKILAVEERLTHYEEMLKENDNELSKGIVKKISKSISDINSTLSHVECFIDKVGNIKVIEDD